MGSRFGYLRFLGRVAASAGVAVRLALRITLSLGRAYRKLLVVPLRARGRRVACTTRLPRRLAFETVEVRAMMTAVTFTNAYGDGNFNSGANYAGGVAPVGGDSVTIATTSATTVTNGDASLSLAGLAVTSSSTTLAGAGLALSGGINVDSGLTATIDASISTGQLVTSGAGTVVLNAASTLAEGVWTQAGTLVVNAASYLPDGTNLAVGDATAFAAGPPAAEPTFTRFAPRSTFPTDAALAVSAAGVVYANGEAVQTTEDLPGAQAVAGLMPGERLYGSMMPNSSGGVGTGWMLADQPYAVQSAQGGAGSISVIFGPLESYTFNPSDGAYQGANGIQEKLVADAETGVLSFINQQGDVYQFNGFGYGGDDARNGQFLGAYEPGGAKVVVAALDTSASNQISELDFYRGGASQPFQTETLAYNETSTDPNFGRVTSIVLSAWDGAELVDERQVNYAYYDGTVPADGWAGTLESAAQEVYDPASSSWLPSGTSYYRYAGPWLSQALSPQGYSNAVAALGPIGAGTSNADLAPFAAYAFQYSALGEVNQATVAVIGGGAESYSYTYGVDITTNFTGQNIWHHSVEEVRPDGSTYTVFMNLAGEPLVSDLASADGTMHWVTVDQYAAPFLSDGVTPNPAAWRLIEEASPSAVDMSDVSGLGEEGYSSASTLGEPGDIYAHEGLVTEYTYATATTATETTAGNVAGYLESTAILNGKSGTPVPQESYTYFAQAGYALVDDSSDGVVTTGTSEVPVTIYPVATTSDYPDGATANTTSYAYTWWDLPGTTTASAQPETIVTSLPAVTTAQNGPGTQWTTLAVFDPYGNETWDVDADRDISLSQYDKVTGDLLETVANVNTAAALPEAVDDAADTTIALPDLPGTSTAIASPTGDSDFDAQSNFAYDPLGRETLELDPAFTDAAGDSVRTATYTAYIDSPLTLPSGQGEGGQGTEVVTGSGFQVVTPASGSAYAASEYVLMNPLSIEVSNFDGQDTDDLQIEGTSATAIVVGTGSVPSAVLSDLAAAAESPAAYSRWTHYDYATAGNTPAGYALGELVDMKVYSDIAAGTFDQTTYGYDADGEENRVVDPTGTITRMVYDARGLEASEWIGTADAGATDSDPTGGRTAMPTPSSTNNMLPVVSYVYDNGAEGGDGNVTETINYVSTGTIGDLAADDRVTLDGYDWRDRVVWAMIDDLTPDPNNPGSTRKTYTVNTYDNLDDVIDVTRYYDLANTEGLSGNAPNSGDPVIGRSGAAYDNLGNEYQTIAYNEPGTVAIVSNTWYDGDGDTIMVLGGGTQEFTKTVYDGLGDAVTTYDGYDPTNSAVTYAAAGSVSGDVILTQTNSTFDAAGDDLFDTTYNRLPTASTSDTGGLDTVSGADSQVSYAATWYDGLGRDVADVNYGVVAAAGETVPSPPSATNTEPTGIDTTGLTQVTFATYNARGEEDTTTDSAGRVTKYIDDDAGRNVETIQNYAMSDGLPVMESDENLATVTAYGAGQQTSFTGTLSPNGADTSRSTATTTYLLPAGAIGGGEMYLLSSAAGSGDPRFEGVGSDGLVLADYGPSGWTYYNGDSASWLPFAAEPSDVLVASVSVAGGVTDLAGTCGTLGGAQLGYQSGTLTFEMTSSYEDGTTWYDVRTTGSGSIVPNFLVESSATYIYDSIATAGSGGPDLYTNENATAIIYAGSTNIYNASAHDFTNGTSGYDRVEYTFDRQDETTSYTDQNGTTHAYAYDGIGHELSDTITVASGNPYDIDTTIASIDYTYKVCGRPLTVSEENSSGEIVNQVKYVYDSNGNLEYEYQEHDGAVTTSTIYVAYGYDDSTSTLDDPALGGDVTIADTGFRPTTLQYPTTGTNTSRVITDNYGTSGSMDDEINQLDAIIDGSGTAADPTTGDTLDTLTSLGDGTLVGETYNQPNLGYNLLGSTTLPGASTPTPNLDQFNRVQNMVWSSYGTGTPTLDGYDYAFNLQGDDSMKANLVDAALSEMYSNDKLDQLTSDTRGTISTSDGVSTIADPTYEENFSADGVGNITNDTVQQSEDGTLTTTLDQSRTANPTNEIASVTNASGEAAWATPTYDQAGNATITPSPSDPSEGLNIQVDGWNRPTHVWNSTIDVSYQYDGLSDMIVSTNNLAPAGTASTTDVYYTGQQVLESDQRAPSSPADAVTTVSHQYVYSPRYVDAPILDTQTTSTYSADTSMWTSATATYYFLTDANNNVTAITNSSGAVQERYVYSAFGTATIYSPDYSAIRSASAVNNSVLFGGMQLDTQTGLYRTDTRLYNPVTSTFLTTDPLGTGANLYEYCLNNPTGLSDPTGLLPASPDASGPGGGPSWSAANNSCSGGFGDDEGESGNGSFGDEAGAAASPAAGIFQPDADGIGFSFLGQHYYDEDDALEAGVDMDKLHDAMLLASSRPQPAGPSWWESNHVGTRIVGGLQAVGGTAEAAGGYALLGLSGLVEFGTAALGTPAAVGLAILGAGFIVHGADVSSAGINQAWTGAQQQTQLEQALVGQGVVDPEGANAISNALTVAGGFLTGAGERPCGPPAVAASRAATKLTGFSAGQATMVGRALEALRGAGYDTGLLKELIHAPGMPAGYRGMSLEGGAALGDEAFSSQDMLNHVLEEELLHGQQKAAGLGSEFGPGTAQSLEEAAGGARKFPLPVQ